MKQTPSRRLWVLGSILTVLITGCQMEAATGTWEVERGVVGDTTIVHTVAGQVWRQEMGAVEDLTIGVLDGPEELIFGEVFRLAEDRHGGVYVHDRQGPIIRHYDANGEFVSEVGGAGEGPEEYQSLILGMVVDPSGTLYVSDWGNGRIVRFTESGEPLDPWPLASAYLTTDLGTWIFEDGRGRILVRGSVDDHPALLVLEGGEVVDTLRVPKLEGMPDLRGGPYSVDLYWGWSRQGHFVVGVSNEYSFEARRAGGVLRVSRAVEALPVFRPEADAWIAQFEWMEREPAYRPPEGEWIPARMPPFREITVGADGRTWVRRNTHPVEIAAPVPSDGQPPVNWAQPYLFDVFDADGSYLGEVEFPEGVAPMLFGASHIWGVRRGDFDEQYVTRMSLLPVDPQAGS